MTTITIDTDATREVMIQVLWRRAVNTISENFSGRYWLFTDDDHAELAELRKAAEVEIAVFHQYQKEIAELERMELPGSYLAFDSDITASVEEFIGSVEGDGEGVWKLSDSSRDQVFARHAAAKRLLAELAPATGVA